MKKNGAEFYIDRKGEHRWRLWSRNGRIVAECGEGYKTYASAKKGFFSAMRQMLSVSLALARKS